MKKAAAIILLLSLQVVAYSQTSSSTTASRDSISAWFGGWDVQEVAPGGRIDAIRQLEKDVVLCAGRGKNKGKLFISEDKGITWRFLAQPVSIDITCIAETGNRKEFYILTALSDVWGTSDGGISWRHLKSLLPANRNRQHYAASYAIMYTRQGSLLVTDTDSDGGHVYRSTDKGIHWQDLGAVSHNALYRLEQTGNGIVVNGWQGAVYKSIDDGITWNKMQQLADTALFATEYMGMSVLLQANQAGTIYRSPNLGYEWDSVAHFKGAADDFVNIGYGAAYYGTYTDQRNVYVTTDYGKNWISLDTIPTVASDWLDHGIRIETTDSIITLAGTNKGFIIRKAFHKQQLAALLESYNGYSSVIKDKRNLIVSDKEILETLVDVQALNEPEDIVVHNGYAYLPCRDGNNVAIIDYRNPRQPVVVNVLRDKDILDAFSVAIEGNTLYVLSMTNAMVSIYSIANPRSPVKLSSIKVGGEGSYLPFYRSNYTRLRKLTVQDGYVYVTHSSESKVYIIDVHKVAAPFIVSSFHTGDGAFGVLVHGNVLYLAGYGPGSSVIAVDIKDKRNPVITSRTFDTIKLKGTCALAIHGHHLYITAYNAETVWSFDISDPLQPKPITHISDPAMRGPGRIAFYGDKAFVLNSVNHSVAIIHTDDNGAIRIQSFLQHPLLKRVYGIAIDKDQLLLTGREAKSFLILSLPAVLQATQAMIPGK